MTNTSLGREVIEDLGGFQPKAQGGLRQDRPGAQHDAAARAGLLYAQQEGRHQPARACRSAGTGDADLVSILDAMEGQGFVERRVAGSDRRAKEIYITETGKVVAGEIDDIAVSVRAQVIAGISESDLKTTLNVFEPCRPICREFAEYEVA
jgi:MarR family transcriptional regulator for hemolysin